MHKFDKHPAAVMLGRLGGLVTSPKKAAAARRNGRKQKKSRKPKIVVDKPSA